MEAVKNKCVHKHAFLMKPDVTAITGNRGLFPGTLFITNTTRELLSSRARVDFNVAGQN